jgi:hypothetical protein
MKNQANREIRAQNVDGWCEDIVFIPEDVGGWVWTVNYVPEDEALPDSAGIGKALGPGVAVAIIYAVIAAIIAAAAVVIFAIWTVNHPAYPKLYWGIVPSTGEYALMTREEKVTSEQILHPGWIVDPTTGTALNPNDPNYPDQRDMLYDRTPVDWGQPKTYDTGSWGGIVNMLIIAAVAIGGVVVAVKVLPSLLKRKSSPRPPYPHEGE